MTILSFEFPLPRQVECSISYIVFLWTVLNHIKGALNCKVYHCECIFFI